eukprot:2855300-Pleurochrysis_carterae.AAC.2
MEAMSWKGHKSLLYDSTHLTAKYGTPLLIRGLHEAVQRRSSFSRRCRVEVGESLRRGGVECRVAVCRVDQRLRLAQLPEQRLRLYASRRDLRLRKGGLPKVNPMESKH